MKSLFLFAVALFVLSISAHAANPREELQQLVAQLQRNPSDTALREKIIKLAQTIKPAPAVPEEANRAFVRGNAFHKGAKHPDDYNLAIQSYREALVLAPWWGDAYYNLSVSQESTGSFDDAIASIKFYIITNPSGKEQREAQNRIYSVEAKRDLAAREKAKVAEQPSSDEELLKKVNGARFIQMDVVVPSDSRGDKGYEVNDRVLTLVFIRRVPGNFDRQNNVVGTWQRVPQTGLKYKGQLRWEDRDSDSTTTVEISRDGRVLTRRVLWSNRQTDFAAYPRTN